MEKLLVFVIAMVVIMQSIFNIVIILQKNKVNYILFAICTAAIIFAVVSTLLVVYTWIK